MLSRISARYEDELTLVNNILAYHDNEALFSQKVQQFDKNAVKAYIILCTHYDQLRPEALNRLRIITPEQFLKKLNNSALLIEADKQLIKYVVDLFEIIIVINSCIDDEHFRQTCWNYLSAALQSESKTIISIYLQLFRRLDRISSTGMPNQLIQKVAEAVHGPISDSNIFTEVLLLIEHNIKKQHNLCNPNTKAAALLRFLWNDLCSSNIMKHQCDNCYMITSYLIDIYLNECTLNTQFRERFLSSDLWSFIRAAIESNNEKKTIRRKQGIYMLQQILEMDSLEVVTAQIIQKSPDKQDCIKVIWKNYFTVLESLLEIQSQLVISCLDQYLEGIVEHLPFYWCTSLFTLVLQHPSNVIVHYGINFILKHQINLQYDHNLMVGFLMALNTTYMFTDVQISIKNLAEFMHLVNLKDILKDMNQIMWRKVPLWSIIASLDVLIARTRGIGVDVSILFAFLRSSIEKIKKMPQVDQFVVNILKNIGCENFTLEHVFSLYEIIPNQKLFEICNKPLDLHQFEEILVYPKKISSSTKIAYFRHAIPNLNERLRLLDCFYENHLNRIVCYPDYEYLLADSLCLKKPLIEDASSALCTLKPRIYNSMRLHGDITIESIRRAASLLSFIVDKHLDVEHAKYSIFESIKKILENLYISLGMVVDDSSMEPGWGVVRTQLTLISGKLIRNVRLYPRDLEILGILAEVVLIDGQLPDLSRFSPSDSNHVKYVQNLYDSFMDTYEDLKPSHTANVITRILTDFPNIKVDTWAVYKILLAAQMDISCIFKLNHPDSIKSIDQVLLHALIYGDEMKGEEKQEYQFIISKSDSTTYIQRVRLEAMRAIAERNHLDQIRRIKHLLFKKNAEIYRIRYYTHSYHHTMKLRIAQAMAFLFRLDPHWDERIFRMLLDEANQVNVTHINELIIAEIADGYQLISLIEKVEGNKGLQSLFMILYYICSKRNDIQFVKKSIEFVSHYIFAKQIIVRTIAQIILLKLCERFDLMDEYKVTYDSIKHAHSPKANRALKYAYAYEYRFNQIDTSNLLHTMYTLREIPRITKMFSDEYYKDELFDAENLNMVMQMNDNDIPEAPIDNVEVELGFIETGDDMLQQDNGNVQRKVVAYRETFIDRAILNSLPEEFISKVKNTESDLIVFGSFLTKPANLGGLSRSAEVFGVKAVTIDNLKSLRQSEFTTLSMAAEKWLKYYEVKDYNVVNYLMAMKTQGFVIVGAEQTAFGQKLHKIPLPRKMVLVMGHEKNGIPANVLNILDMAIEIPQFGVVRSLNVHVTASLFMWEYSKQHLLTDDSSPDNSLNY